ncbi:NlpC/P60 family protein [Fictibacillus sp. KIGAM418]|uniref:NlpC/P60 family protein n=1 Tax=Fictibacillus marinisediminis TaxID=2878389 RepID=A0A9X1XDX2_9BACL|nr:NlpC/P60 family protein [Fictibacillus marinisediminis]MCK6257250.1 NlpC/P60 family protein [Fictibacillus marinisediminis]
MKRLLMGLGIAGILTANPLVGQAALGDHTLKYGMTHTEVKDLQQTLKTKGYFTYSTTTTYFGTYTVNAVKSFQKSKGLTADGVAGPATFKALGIYPSYSKTQLVSTAKTYLGVPYVWGGTTTSGFDCSGYVDYVFQKSAGITLPRTVADIYKVGTKVTTLSAGDLVFFETYQTGASHVGIYIGNNQFISATSSNGVSIASMSNTYWAPRYLGAKRI